MLLFEGVNILSVLPSCIARNLLFFQRYDSSITVYPPLNIVISPITSHYRLHAEQSAQYAIIVAILTNF